MNNNMGSNNNFTAGNDINQKFNMIDKMTSMKTKRLVMMLIKIIY